MSDPCRILLICDDDLEGLELRRLLGAEVRIDLVHGEGPERVIPLEFEEVVLSGTWEIGIRDRHYHLCIVSTSGASPVAELARHPALRSQISGVLYLMEQGGHPVPAGSLRPGRDRFLVLPCSRAALLHEVEGMLLDALAQRAIPGDDPRYLGLLKSLLADGQRSLRPVVSADDRSGWRFPKVEQVFGQGIDASAVMEHLTTLGICSRSIVQRLRVCPTCACHQLSYGEVCARCASADFVRETIIHHFACAHMDIMRNFEHGGDLVCPKCRKILRQIGRDYEKPSGCYLCHSCSFISTEARIRARCQSCQSEVAPEQTIERLVYSYELTAKADEAVAADDLGGQGLVNLVRDQDSGLYAKPFFLHALQRELDRLRRYQTPVALVLVHSTSIDGHHPEGSDRRSDQAYQQWKAATEGLRTLDVACLWEEGVLAIMLPCTPLAGADMVSQRIADRFRAGTATGAPDREFVLVTVAGRPEHVTAEAMVRDARRALSSQGSTASDVLVVAEDEPFADIPVQQS